jgi:hypothetical protein
MYKDDNCSENVINLKWKVSTEYVIIWILTSLILQINIVSVLGSQMLTMSEAIVQWCLLV